MAGPNISRANLPINPRLGLDALIREHLAFFSDDPCEDQGVPGEGQCLIFLCRLHFLPSLWIFAPVSFDRQDPIAAYHLVNDAFSVFLESPHRVETISRLSGGENVTGFFFLPS